MATPSINSIIYSMKNESFKSNNTKIIKELTQAERSALLKIIDDLNNKQEVSNQNLADRIYDLKINIQEKDFKSRRETGIFKSICRKVSNMFSDRVSSSDVLDSIEGLKHSPPLSEILNRKTNQEKETLLENTKNSMDAFKADKLSNYSDTKEAKEMANIGVDKFEIHDHYEIDPQAVGFVGIGHKVLTKIRRKIDHAYNAINDDGFISTSKKEQKIFGGGGIKIHLSIDPTIPGNRLKALEALLPILSDPSNGVVQFKFYSNSKKSDLKTWFEDTGPRPGGQQGKEITLYFIDKNQIEIAKKNGVSKKDLKLAKQFVKSPKEIADLINRCKVALVKAGVKGLGYQQNVSDKYLSDDHFAGFRDDRGPSEESVDQGYVGEHDYWRTRTIGDDGKEKDCLPKWEDISPAIMYHLKNS